MILRGLLQLVKPRPTRSPFSGRLHPRDQFRGIKVAARVLLTAGACAKGVGPDILNFLSEWY